MDDDIFKPLKQSAFLKAANVGLISTKVTIGPQSLENKSPKQVNSPKLEQSPVTKFTSPNLAVSKPSPIKKLLRGLEKLSLEEMNEAVSQRQQQLLDFEMEQRKKRNQRWYIQQQLMVEKVREQENQIYKALEEYNKKAVLENEKLIEYHQNFAARRKKKDEELQEKERQKQELLRIVDILKKDKVLFRECFEEIVNLTKTHESNYLKTNLVQLSTKLKVLRTKMDEISGKCKNGNVSEDDISTSKNNLKELKLIQEKIINELDAERQKEEILKQERIKEQKLKEEQLREEQLREEKLKEAAKKELKSNPNIKETQSSNKLDNFVSRSALKLYSDHQEYQTTVKNSYNQLEKDENLKQFKFDCKKAINIPVNAISGVNSQHLLDKYNKLSQLLAGKPVQIGDKYISASNHPQGIAYCMDLLAKKFVLQGDLMISSNPEAAFCYGSIIVSLWNQFPDFGKLLLAHFHKQCPYTVPFYLPKSIDQSDRDYYESLGYQYNEDGTVEKQDKFLKRMAGIMRLYSAIIVSYPKKEQGRKNPLALNEGWRWFASILNLEPRVDITATLLQVFLETCGCQMQAGYGKQFVKLMRFLQVRFMPMLKKIDSGGPVTRLESLLQDYCTKGRFEKPAGVLKEGFW